MTRRVRVWLLVYVALILGSTSARGQSSDAWSWDIDGVAFIGENVQHRTEFGTQSFESHNWITAQARRPVGPGSLTLTTILSFEPLTIPAAGSPQFFQLGGTYLGSPMSDHEHPRDLFSGLTASYALPMHAATLRFEGALVGAPALGPPGFEDRPSAMLNPAVPLARQHLDSTEASSGVATVGVVVGLFQLEASAFHGQESDEHRYDLDLGPLDSWSARASISRGDWTAQISTGRIHQPEAFTPFAERRTTASIAFSSERHRTAWTAAWGQDTDRYGSLDAYLLDATIRLSRRKHVYLRLETVANDFLDAGYHLQHAIEVTQISNVAAFTGGYVHDLIDGVGVGADVSVYRVPSNLSGNYPGVYSLHAFLRLHKTLGSNR